MRTVESLVDRLADLAAGSDLSPPEFEALVYRFSPAERRVFECLIQYEQVSSAELRRLVSVSNISEVAARINRKFAALGDTRRISCHRRRAQNEFGFTELQGYWSMGSMESGTA